MRMFSASTLAFYDPALGPVPADAVDVDDDIVAAVLAGQSPTKMIAAGVNGLPVLVDRPAAPPEVPQSVSMRQARLALLGAGLLAPVNEAIAGMPGAQGEAARIEWEFAADVRRDSPLVQALVPVLELDDASLDALFMAAAAL
ncbi:MAG: hypothetical protein K2X51_12495 [Burkholderiales bacterium]|nr:hypothetical protein [Burkholderiales bacterium]